jgi:hypothetical protein
MDHSSSQFPFIDARDELGRHGLGLCQPQSRLAARHGTDNDNADVELLPAGLTSGTKATMVTAPN